MTAVTMLDAKCDTAEELLAVLKRLKRGGFDLSAIYVCNGVGENFGSVELTQKKLTDNSVTHDIRFFLHQKYE